MKPLVLFVDNDAQLLETYTFLFGDYHGCEVRTAKNAEEAILLAKNLERPAILFLDVHLDGPFEGIKVLQRMLANARSARHVVAIYTASSRRAEAEALGGGGAETFLVKPLEPETVLAYVRIIGQRQIETHHKATRDWLTDLLNRATFTELAMLELGHAVRNKMPTSCVFVDVNKFKSVNDTFGHGVGDTVIKEIARCIKEHPHVVRATDMVVRWSGDEFVVLLPAATYNQARTVADRLEQEVAKTNILSRSGAPFSISISTGVATLDHENIDPANLEETLSKLIDQADEEMYKTKEKQ